MQHPLQELSFYIRQEYIEAQAVTSQYFPVVAE